jgi:hypothetical protein
MRSLFFKFGYMKLFHLFFPLAVLFGCAVHSQKTDEVVRIEFTSLTRGYSSKLELTKDSLVEFSTPNRGSASIEKRKKMNPEDWRLLIQALKNVKLSEVPDLKSPTMKRAYDGARHSTLSFTTANGEVLSHSFDDENPHEKLQPMMKLIGKLKE